MEQVHEKTVKRYCLAAIQDGYCWYLQSLGQDKGFNLVTDIEQATKAATKSVAKYLREVYEYELGKNAYQLIIIPLIIDYSLVKEID